MARDDPSADLSITWRAARHAASIFLGQAVGPLGIGAEQIRQVERGELPPTAELIRRAVALYGLPPGTMLVPEGGPGSIPTPAQPFDPLDGSPGGLPAVIAFRPAAIAAARAARGWSLKQAGERIGVTASTAHRLENDPRTINGRTALRAMEVLGVEPEVVQVEWGSKPPDGVVVLKLKPGRGAVGRPQAGVTSAWRAEAGEPSGQGGPTDPPAKERNDMERSTPAARTVAGAAPWIPATQEVVPVGPGAPIELVACPAPGYLIGRTARDRDALRLLGGELMRGQDVSSWSNVVARDDLGPIDLDPTVRKPNGLNEGYRSRLVDLLLADQSLGEAARELARLTWGVGMDYRTARSRTGLSETTAKEYFYKMRRRLRKLWAMGETRRRAVELFGEVYGVDVGMDPI